MCTSSARSHSTGDIERALETAQRAQAAWRSLTLAARCELLRRAVDAFVVRGEDIAAEITWQMGRPLRHAPGEVRGFEERARYMLDVAPEALAAVQPGDKPGFRRQIKRVPLGVVVVVAPWNYPYLTAVNAVLPALIAGNAVVLKHSHQTPLCAERFFEAFAAAGVPAGVFQYLHLSHADTSRLMADARVACVCFTGSVAGGKAVVAATAAGFATAGLELGGKDPAYVRADANLSYAVESLSDGAFYNAGQSCCGIKRIYVAARSTRRSSRAWSIWQANTGWDRRSMRTPRSDRWCARLPPTRCGRRSMPRSRTVRASSSTRSPSRLRSKELRTWHRRCWSMSTTRWRSCAKRPSVPQSASCAWIRTSRPCA